YRAGRSLRLRCATSSRRQRRVSLGVCCPTEQAKLVDRCQNDEHDVAAGTYNASAASSSARQAAIMARAASVCSPRPSLTFLFVAAVSKAPHAADKGSLPRDEGHGQC